MLAPGQTSTPATGYKETIGTTNNSTHAQSQWGRNEHGCVLSSQVVSDSWDPMDCSLTGFSIHRISQASTLGFGEGNGNPPQYSCPENPMDGGAWQAAVHGVAKSRTQLSYFTFTFHFHALEKEMATHSSVLSWRIPGMTEPGRLPSMGSHRVGHD